MQSDETQIRQLVDQWLSATREGDVDRVLELMTEDVVFLAPGRPPMRKEEFASLARLQAGSNAPKIDGKSEIREIQVFGDWAFMWTELTVVVTPPGGAPVSRSGHTLTVLRKENGAWRLARDANMLSQQAPAERH